MLTTSTSPILNHNNSPGSLGSLSPASFRHANAHATHAHGRHHPHTYSQSHHHRQPSHSASQSQSASGDSPSLQAGVAAVAAAAAVVAGPIPRRPSSRTASSPSFSMNPPATSRSRRNDTQPAVDSVPVPAPVPVTTASRDSNPSSSQPTPHDPPPAPRPESMTKDTTTTTSTTPSSQNPTALPSADPSTVLSPNKRRVSPEPASLAQNASTTTAEATGQTATKRAKAEDSPPKELPQKYEFCAVDDMVELIAHMLSELITTNDAIRITSVGAGAGLTRFHSRTAPGISVRDYLHRLAKHATLTPPLLLAMVYYIDRLCLMYPEFTINTLTVHRFLIVAATVAAKGLSDAFWNNATYARVGGVRLQELKLLELEFLHRVDWKIVPNPEDLVAYYQGLVERTPGYSLEDGDSSDEDLLGDDESE